MSYNKPNSGEMIPNVPPGNTGSNFDPSAANSYNYAGYYSGGVPGQQYQNQQQQQYDPATIAHYQQYYQQYYANYANAQAQGSYDPQQYAAYYQQGGAANQPEQQTQADDKKEEDDEEEEEDDPTVVKQSSGKAANKLPIHCNDKMGLNPLIFSNILQSPYFKTTLFQLKTYHEVIDEIYYSVKHLEPWEKGSRKAGGPTTSVLCGSVRGVGSGGIISTPFCLLYKLFTLKLTRKQVNGLIRHKDSPFIRALGFMYIRFTQPPKDLWTWFEPFLEDDEELDPKAGGGDKMTIGEMLRSFLTQLDWYSSLFPRIPIPIQKEIEAKLNEYDGVTGEERGDDRRKETAKKEAGSSRAGHSNKRYRDSDRDDTHKRPRSVSRERDSYNGRASSSSSKSSKYGRERDDHRSYHRY